MARRTGTKKAPPAQTVLARKAAALKATTAAPRLNPTLAKANAEHQLEAGLGVAIPAHEHDCTHTHVARAPPRTPRTKTAQAERFVVPPACFSISSFCVAHHLSEAMFFKLRGQGRGPDELRIGARVLITFESAANWRARMEKETAAATAAE